MWTWCLQVGRPTLSLRPLLFPRPSHSSSPSPLSIFNHTQTRMVQQQRRRHLPRRASLAALLFVAGLLPTVTPQQLRRPPIALLQDMTIMPNGDITTNAQAGNTTLPSRAMYDALVPGHRHLAAGGNAPFFPLVAIVLDPRGVQDRSPSKHWLFPACGFAQPIVEAPAYCPLDRVVEAGAALNYAINRRAFAQVTTMYATEKEPSQDTAGSLPKRMADVGHPLPFEVTDKRVVENERQTVYWYYRNILNFYMYVKRCVQADQITVEPPPYVPHGYHSQRLIFTDDNRQENDPPIGQTFILDNHLILVMRGTVFKAGFVQDETFGYEDPNHPNVLASGLHGRLHKGFFSQAMVLVQQLEEELDAHPGVTLLSLAGHSLGAAYEQLVAPILTLRRPALEVEAWNLGAPPVGDAVFVAQYNSLPNLRARSFMYLGNGLLTTAPTPFGVGDVVPQAPGMCWPVPGCPMTQNPDVGLRVKYEVTGGVVAFYSHDMPNTEGWNRVDQVVTLDSSPSACHGCSYLCWSVQGLDDPEDRCYFSEQNHKWACPYSRLDNN